MLDGLVADRQERTLSRDTRMKTRDGWTKQPSIHQRLFRLISFFNTNDEKCYISGHVSGVFDHLNQLSNSRTSEPHIAPPRTTRRPSRDGGTSRQQIVAHVHVRSRVLPKGHVPLSPNERETPRALAAGTWMIAKYHHGKLSPRLGCADSSVICGDKLTKKHGEGGSKATE